jgi:hypothetical protein
MLANWAAAAAEDVAFGRRGLLPGVLCSIEAMLASWAAAAAEDGAFGRQQPRPRQWEGTVEELWEIPCVQGAVAVKTICWDDVGADDWLYCPVDAETEPPCPTFR